MTKRLFRTHIKTTMKKLKKYSQFNSYPDLSCTDVLFYLLKPVRDRKTVSLEKDRALRFA